MGFFDKIKSVLGKLEDVNLNDVKLDNLKGVIENAATSLQKNFSSNTSESEATPTQHEKTTSRSMDIYDTGDSYFASLITQENFPEYTITSNLHAREFDETAHPSCYPISYLFSDGSKPILAVIIIQTNQYRSMIARGTYDVLDNNNIPYIRFFKGMENEKGYVLNRIRENLR